MTIYSNKQPIYSFGLIDDKDQIPVAIWTVLSVNEVVGDCAAYEGVAPFDADDAMLERVRGLGNKIRAEAAREMFPQIEEQELRYRR